MMSPRRLICLGTVLAVVVIARGGNSFFKEATYVDGARSAAATFVNTLSDAQREQAVLPIDSPLRAEWHIIPKDTRKGLQLREMSGAQRAAAKALLQSLLSKVGYSKATQIMNMENLLKEFEAGREGTPMRDPERYYFTVFGKPEAEQKWGVSIEGHHMSLNFLLEGEHVVSSTPQAFAANPAVVRNENSFGVDLGTRMLRVEEIAAFELVHSLSDKQKAIVILGDSAPREIRALGVSQPPQDPAVGIAFNELSSAQQKILRRLVNEYIRAVPDEVADARRQQIRDHGGWEAVRFAWQGAQQPGVGHYYRIQGPTFLIELVNTQPDAAGNIANHIHCAWRDIRGDFGVKL